MSLNLKIFFKVSSVFSKSKETIFRIAISTVSALSGVFKLKRQVKTMSWRALITPQKYCSENDNEMFAAEDEANACMTPCSLFTSCSVIFIY